MPPAATNHDFSVCGLKGVPPAAKNRVVCDFGLKGVPPAAKIHFRYNLVAFLYKDVFFNEKVLF